MAKLLHVSYTNFPFSIPVASAPIDEIIQLLLFVSQAISESSIHPSQLSELSSEHVSSWGFLPAQLPKPSKHGRSSPSFLLNVQSPQ